MAPPTDEEMKAYADTLPEIYQDIMAAFPAIEPIRRKHDGLAIQTLLIHLADQDKPYGFGQIEQACEKLQEIQFVEIKNKIFVHPTEFGEQLIAVLTGQSEAPVEVVPSPPTPSWMQE